MNLKQKIVIIFIFISFKICAQIPVLYNVTSDNNLPSNDIYSIVQDNKGFIWLGTDAGLYKFNGLKYEYFSSSEQKSKAVSGLTISKDNRIYFYNFSGQIFYIENEKIVELQHPYKGVSSILTDSIGNLWLSHGNGSSIWNKETKHWTLIKEGLSRFGINEKNQNIFITHKNGLTIHSNNSKVEIDMEFLPEINYAQVSFVFYENELLLFEHLSSKIIKIINKKQIEIKNQTINLLLKNKKITNVKLLSDGFIWISTYSGLIKYNPKNGKAEIYYENIIFTNSYIDNENNYWFTTISNGYFIAPNSNILVYNQQNGQLFNEKVKSIQLQDSILYFSTSDGYIGKLNTLKNIGPIVFNSNLKSDINTFLYEKKHQKAYFNINGIFHEFNGREIKVIHHKSPPIKCITTGFGKYFIGTSLGLDIVNDIKKPLLINSIISDWVNNISIDSVNHKIFIGSNNGLFILKHENGNFKKKLHLLRNKQIRGLTFEYSNNTAYLVTVEGKIFSLKDQKLNLIENLRTDILVNHMLYSQDKLILSSNQGIRIWNLKTKQWIIIDKNTGLASNDIKQTIIDHDLLWAASSKGIHKIPINQGYIKPLAIIHLQKLVNENIKTRQNKIEINYKSPLQIFVDVTHFSSLGKHKVVYRINRGNWITANNESSPIILHSLPHGDVDIELKATDIFNRDSKNTISLNVYVNPPYWLNKWFISALFLVLVALIFFLIKWRVNNARIKQKEEYDKIYLENQLVLSQETALKAQMKPHFVFNVLNSIKSFIYENDKENAVKYLTLFSGLVRNVLEMSNKNKNTLEEELTTLEYFIKLEALLLETNFNYFINIDKNIQTSEISIPSLIIQPFVENAFKHGLRHKKGPKFLNIHFFKPQNDILEIHIADNGIGRKAAQEINSKSATLHQSFATKTSNQRIKLLNTKNTGIIGLEYIDLENEKNEIIGTKVILKITITE